MDCSLGWVDFETGIQVGAEVIDNAKKQFFKMFLEFVIWYSFEDLQKNASKMCENSVVSKSRLFCVSFSVGVLPGPETVFRPVHNP